MEAGALRVVNGGATELGEPSVVGGVMDAEVQQSTHRRSCGTPRQVPRQSEADGLSSLLDDARPSFPRRVFTHSFTASSTL